MKPVNVGARGCDVGKPRPDEWNHLAFALEAGQVGISGGSLYGSESKQFVKLTKMKRW